MVKCLKLTVLSLIVCALGMNLNAASQKTITTAQARKYIENIIDNLFIANNHNGSYAKGLKDFTSNISIKVLNQFGSYPNVFSFSKEYNAQELYQPIVNASVDFIESKSAEYAQTEIKKLDVSYRVDTSKIVSKVSKQIRDEISTKVNLASYLDTGVFTNYYGASLNNKVHDLLVKELKQANDQNYTHPQTHLYPTTDCPVCLERFSSTVDHQLIQRVFLKCGHNLCINCLRRLYNVDNHNSKAHVCPLCRASINMDQYHKELFAPSAPPY